MKAFLFDMDGTLIDSMPFHTRSWLATLHEFGINITAAELFQHNRGTMAEVLQRIVGNHSSPSDLAAIAERKEAHFRRIYRPRLKCLPGVRAFLKTSHKQGISMALATSAGRENIDFILDGLSLRPYFTAVVGAEDVDRGKPDPETFLTAAKKLGVSAKRCLAFEDSLAGIEAAANAGMRTVVITSTHEAHEVEMLPGVVRVVEDYKFLDPQSLVQISLNP